MKKEKTFISREEQISKTKTVLKSLIETGIYPVNNNDGITEDQLSYIQCIFVDDLDLEVFDEITFHGKLTMDPEWREIAKKRFVK